MGVALIEVVVHKDSGHPEYGVYEFPDDLGYDPWLGRDHLSNRGHGPGSGFQGLPD